MTHIILPSDSDIYRAFQQMAAQKRMLFFAGLPGTGKSLLLQQMALLAQAAGRTVHLLQWDVTRAPFETAVHLARYPEVDGVTHAAIRKGVGLWARTAVQRWQEQYDNPQHILIGETPLIGNRLVELVQVHEDGAESLLQSEAAQFIVPAPSTRVRAVIEAARAKSIAKPQHEREAADAPPNVLQMLWQDVNQLAYKLGVVNQTNEEQTSYDTAVYTGIYQYLLRHRHQQTFIIDEIYSTHGSVYEVENIGSELMASPAEVDEIMQMIEQTYTPETLATAVAHWYEVW